MGRFFDELKRRNVVRVGVAYVIVGWILIEAASVLFPGFEAPDWIFKVFATLVIFGFPLAMLFAWAFEITPEGIKRTAEVPLEHSIAQRTGRKLDFIIIALLVVALGISVALNIAQRDGVLEQRVAETTSGRSIAVRPFDNFSPDEENAFFAAGVHEDILTHLQRVRDLKVISRSSVMQYADRDVTAATIADELGVAYIVEGSVRRAGNTVRVSAQLIDARTDEHLWADTFDRELSDIFAIQTAIAQEIVAALAATLSSEEAAAISSAPTDSLEAYDLFLKARHLKTSTGGFVPSDDFAAIELLEKAVRLDPRFVDAWALIANIDGDLYWFLADRTPERLAHMKNAVDRAIDIDPDSPAARTALAEYYYRSNYDYDKAMEQLEIAYSKAPNDVEILYNMGLTLRRLGRWDESVERFQQAAALDPAAIRTHSELLVTAYDAADWPRALRLADEYGRRFPENAAIAGPRALTYLWSDGDVQKARETLETAAPNTDEYYYVWASFEIPLFAREYEHAVTALANGTAWDVVSPGFGDAFIGEFWLLAGETEKAEAAFSRAMEAVQTQLAQPHAANYAWPHYLAALVHALRGEAEDARRECGEVTSILPMERDRVHGTSLAALCARVRGLIGDTDFALDELERLHALPSAGGMMPGNLKYDPRWDFLRDEPRFQAVLESLEPATAPSD